MSNILHYIDKLIKTLGTNKYKNPTPTGTGMYTVNNPFTIIPNVSPKGKYNGLLDAMTRIEVVKGDNIKIIQVSHNIDNMIIILNGKEIARGSGYRLISKGNELGVQYIFTLLDKNL